MSDGEIELAQNSMVLGASEQLVVPVTNLNLLQILLNIIVIFILKGGKVR